MEENTGNNDEGGKPPGGGGSDPPVPPPPTPEDKAAADRERERAEREKENAGDGKKEKMTARESIFSKMGEAGPGDPESGPDDARDPMDVPLSDRWSQFENVESCSYPEPHPEMEEKLRDLLGVRVIIVTGTNAERTRAEARQLAVRSQRWKSVREAEHRLVSGDSYNELLELIGSGERRCLIIGRWNDYPATHLASSLADLSAALENSTSRDFCLIAWTFHRQFHASLPKNYWPGNIHHYELKEPPSPSERSAATEEEFYRVLFDGAPEDVFAEDRAIIERALARICVLFGELPDSDFDDLMEIVLKGKEIMLDPPAAAVNQPGRMERAAVVWDRRKTQILARAGMGRDTRGNITHFVFRSDTARRTATAIAWEDSGAMREIFSALRGAAILFSDKSPWERKALFEGYIAALSALTVRHPHLFGANWLDSVCLEYLDWVRTRTADLPAEESTGLLTLLQMLRKLENRKIRAALERRFAERMGELCRVLAVEARSAVESFLQLLAARNLHSLLLPLSLYLWSSPVDPVKWVKTALRGDPAQFPMEPLRMPAWDCLRGLARLESHCSLFRDLLPDAEETAPGRLPEAALLFPLVLINEWHTSLSRGRHVETSLEAALLPGGVVRSYWLACLGAPQLPERAAARADEEDPQYGHLAIALALFQLVAVAAGAGEAGRRAGLNFADEVRRLPHSNWSVYADFWTALMARFERSSVDSKKAAARKAADQNREHCRQLLQL